MESEDETLALLGNYGCHPTVLGPEKIIDSEIFMVQPVIF
jgi:hypothetical protein